MKAVVLVIVAVTIASCTTYRPPTSHGVEKTRTLDMSYDAVWSRLVAYVSERDYPIARMDKASGIISTEESVPALARYADCGIDGWDDPIGGGSGDVDILVVDTGDGVRVTVNASFKPRHYLADNRGAVPVCVSTGELEREIFTYLTL